MDNLAGAQSLLAMLQASMLREHLPPPKTLPCANVQVEVGTPVKICDRSGTLACSACKLVSYCAKVSGYSCLDLTINSFFGAGVPESTLEDSQARSVSCLLRSLEYDTESSFCRL